MTTSLGVTLLIYDMVTLSYSSLSRALALHKYKVDYMQIEGQDI